MVEEPWRGDPNKSLQILWNPYKSLQLLLSPYKSLHITGNLHKPLQILTTPYKSLHILTHPQRLRWERGQRLGNLDIARSPKRAVFLLSFYLKKTFFKDPDEHYTNDLSLPLHHNPPNKIVSFSTKINLVEEPWRVILTTPYNSLQLLTTP